MKVTLEPLGLENWLEACRLSVGDDQRELFPIANVYWIGISRYEEKSELFAICCDGEVAGLIGGGLYTDGVNAHVNPLMVDRRFQRQGIARRAMELMATCLQRRYDPRRIYVGHRRANRAAAGLYEALGYRVESETEQEVTRVLRLEATAPPILSIRDQPQCAPACVELLTSFFSDRALMEKNVYGCLETDDGLPQGYLMLEEGTVVGWVGLQAREVVLREDLTPWITPLIVAEGRRGRRYGKALLDWATAEAGRLGYAKAYLTTNHIGFYEKYGFREIGLTTFTWGAPTKVYERDTGLMA